MADPYADLNAGGIRKLVKERNLPIASNAAVPKLRAALIADDAARAAQGAGVMQQLQQVAPLAFGPVPLGPAPPPVPVQSVPLPVQQQRPASQAEATPPPYGHFQNIRTEHQPESGQPMYYTPHFQQHPGQLPFQPAWPHPPQPLPFVVQPSPYPGQPAYIAGVRPILQQQWQQGPLRQGTVFQERMRLPDMQPPHQFQHPAHSQFQFDSGYPSQPSNFELPPSFTNNVPDNDVMEVSPPAGLPKSGTSGEVNQSVAQRRSGNRGAASDVVSIDMAQNLLTQITDRLAYESHHASTCGDQSEHRVFCREGDVVCVHLRAMSLQLASLIERIRDIALLPQSLVRSRLQAGADGDFRGHAASVKALGASQFERVQAQRDGNWLAADTLHGVRTAAAGLSSQDSVFEGLVTGFLKELAGSAKKVASIPLDSVAMKLSDVHQCPKPSRERGEQRSARNDNRHRATTDSSAEEVTCFKCGQKGHYATKCPNPRAEDGKDRSSRSGARRRGGRSRSSSRSPRRSPISRGDALAVTAGEVGEAPRRS
jgi:Zinc knuckle